MYNNIKNHTQVSSTSNTNSKRTRFCRRPRAAAMRPHHAPTVTCNSQSSGQSVRPVMQSPLQQLSAGSLRVNLFIVVQTVGERSRGDRCGRCPSSRGHRNTNRPRRMLKCTVSARLTLIPLRAALNVHHFFLSFFSTPVDKGLDLSERSGGRAPEIDAPPSEA